MKDGMVQRSAHPRKKSLSRSKQQWKTRCDGTSGEWKTKKSTGRKITKMTAAEKKGFIKNSLHSNTNWNAESAGFTDRSV